MPASEPPRLIVITGIMAAGKSQVAQALAERLPRSVHLRGDVFRRMIVTGRAEMGVDLSSEAAAQLGLRYRLAAATAKLYLQAGFTVVYQDIIIGAGLRPVLTYHRHRPLHLVVLCPSPDAVAAREAGRSKKAYRGEEIAGFDRVLRQETPRLGLWVDSSHLTVEETVHHILAHLEEARINADAC